MKKKFIAFFAAVILMVIATGCADHAETVIQCADNCHTYGFWGGLWHGFIAFFDFIGMLIWDDVTVYAQNNNGGWYAFGFLLGMGALGGGGATITSKVSK